MKCTFVLSLIFLFFLVGNINAQKKCNFEIRDTLYFDTAYIYRIFEDSSYEYYIDFSSKFINDFKEVKKKINNSEMKIYLSSLTLEGFLIESKRYNLKSVDLGHFYDKNLVYSEKNMEVELIINKKGYVLFSISGFDLNTRGYYSRKRYGIFECLNCCTTISPNCEIELND